MEENATDRITSEEIISEPQETNRAEPEGSASVLNDTGVDYAQLVKEDIAALSSEFPELASLTEITELENPLRYAALRDMGLTPAEAYLATARSKRSADNRSHLHGAVPQVAQTPKGAMPEQELAAARELFSDIPDSEIRKLYRRVTR